MSNAAKGIARALHDTRRLLDGINFTDVRTAMGDAHHGASALYGAVSRAREGVDDALHLLDMGQPAD